MQIEVKEIEPCKLSIQYTADAEEILNKRGEIISAFKKAPVPGFRPGKATVDAIKMHYRSQIEDSLKRALAEDAYHNTLFEKKLKPHGAPRFNSLLLADGKFVCEFDLHTKPSFELAPFHGMEIVKPHNTETIVEMTEKLLQELRVRFGEAIPYGESDFVQRGDNIIIDYDGFLEGEKVDNLCAVGEMLTIGASDLPQFDDNVLGMALEETREFDLQVPANGIPSLAGKTVHIKATLKMGSKTIPCPLDDTLATKMGKTTFAELRELASGTAQAALQNKVKQQLNEAIANKLIVDNQVDVPPWMSLSEAQYLTHQAHLEWAKLNDIDKEQYILMSEKNVKLSLVLDKVRELNPEAQLTDQEVFDILKSNLARTKATQSVDEVIQQMNKSGYLQILFSRIRDEYAMDFIAKSVKVIE
jgi:trigger factor